MEAQGGELELVQENLRLLTADVEEKNKLLALYPNDSKKHRDNEAKDVTKEGLRDAGRRHG